MSTVLSDSQRKHLDTTVQKAREASEAAARDALTALAVGETHRPAHLDDAQNELRLALRAKARQLGDDVTSRGADLTLLVRDVAYEQWHRLLFARFLERNGLLRHADFPDTAVFLEDCEELASSGDIDEPDGWSVAARFAAQLLPGVFRLDDPAFRVRYATEHRLALEQLLMSIPAEVFEAEDALGWVYQFWQTAEKKRVNERGDKIGGADLSPVTQLFTENYMVRFLLENSLGAWWAAKHPESPLVAEWDYLRRLDDGTPAAGTFAEWPATAAEVTVMDPCCGSGHFLVAMFGMLWRMRAEEEGLSPAEAQDAVLRDNLFGLELDPRCTQIATFNVALEAWKQGGHRALPTPLIACSGVPVRQSREEWLDGVPEHLHDAMARLHTQFVNADTLGSLIDPRPVGTNAFDGAMFGRDMTVSITWEQLQHHLAAKFAREGDEGTVLDHATEDVVRANELLVGVYTLIATNPPFLGLAKMSQELARWAENSYPEARHELALMMLERWSLSTTSSALVLPSEWLYLRRYSNFRRKTLNLAPPTLVTRLGRLAFTDRLRVDPALIITKTGGSDSVGCMDWETDARRLTTNPSNASIASATIRELLRDPEARIIANLRTPSSPLSEYATARAGYSAGDANRFERLHWEVVDVGGRWQRLQSTVCSTTPLGGRSKVLLWEDERGSMAALARSVAHLNHAAQNWRRGKPNWGRKGVAVSLMGDLPMTRYDGEIYDINCCAVVPNDPAHSEALWEFALSGEWSRAVRDIDQSLKVAPHTLLKVQFDLDRWTKAAQEREVEATNRLSDPTQWLFDGQIATADSPLAVAIAMLSGYRWPSQGAVYDHFGDHDGIVTLSNLGEGDAASRLRELLAVAYGDRWSASLEHTLVTEAGGNTGRLDDWLRDTFFKDHCKVFGNRPFLWHVWDGRKDGFSAILNYHRLDRATLEKLTYTTLGSWIRRQEQELSSDAPGAEARLSAAQALQQKLQLIIEGEPPYDIYVRWKALHEQPLGWEPDLDDGVRLNIRPFVEAGILRSKVNVHWKKDRGKNPDGSERHNDLHFTLDEKRAARRAHGLDDA